MSATGDGGDDDYDGNMLLLRGMETMFRVERPVHQGPNSA